MARSKGKGFVSPEGASQQPLPSKTPSFQGWEADAAQRDFIWTVRVMQEAHPEHLQQEGLAPRRMPLQAERPGSILRTPGARCSLSLLH